MKAISPPVSPLPLVRPNHAVSPAIGSVDASSSERSSHGGKDLTRHQFRPRQGRYRFGALVGMLCFLCRNRVRDIGAQAFTNLAPIYRIKFRSPNSCQR